MSRKKLGEDKRYVLIGVKVTPDFRKVIEDRAACEGLTLSTFVHNVLKLYFMQARDA